MKVHMTIPTTRVRQLTLILALLCLNLSTITVAATIYATVDLVEGTVNIVDVTGQSRIPHVKDTIEEGDTIVTGRDGELHAITEDQGLIAVRANTKMKIEAYRAMGDKEDKSIISLISGTYRSVTGWIGKNYPLNYEIRTPSAIIGVRGTDHEPAVIVESNAEQPHVGIPGTYDKVNSGSTVIRNQAGELLVSSGQAGFAPHDGSNAPKALKEVPNFYRPTHNEKQFEVHKELVSKNLGGKPPEKHTKKESNRHTKKESDRHTSEFHRHPIHHVKVKPL